MPFLPRCCDSEAILSKKNVSSRSPGLECSYGKNFTPITEISVAKSEISVTGTARLLIWKNRIFSEEKSGDREARSWKPTQPGCPGRLIWRGPRLRTPVRLRAEKPRRCNRCSLGILYLLIFQHCIKKYMSFLGSKYMSFHGSTNKQFTREKAMMA